MNRPLATSALALILGAGPALAEITPAEVWQSLRDSYQQMGYDVQVGTEDASDQALTLTDITLTADGDDAATMTFNLPQIVMTAVGDGTVRSVIDGQMTLESRSVVEGSDEPVGFAMTLDAPDNQTVTSGTPEAMQHDVTMPTLTVAGRALDDINDVPLSATLTGVSGMQSVTTDDAGASAQTFEGRADLLEMQIRASGPSLNDPEADAPAPDAQTPEAPTPDTQVPDTQAQPAMDTFQANVSIADLTMQGDGTSPAGEVNFSSQPSEALAAGFAGSGSFGMGAMSGSFASSAVIPDGGRTDGEGSFEAAGGTLAVGLSAEGLSYEGGLADMAVSLTSTDMPFPIAYAAVENRFRLAMPVVASDQAQPFALSYVLDGLTLDDAIWQALDPEAALPRDPASLTIDIEGDALLTQNFMDPDFAQTSEAGPDGQPQVPLLPRSLTINEIVLDAVGARADLAGALTFGDDPSQPLGTINGTFTGINGLLDTLVSMGVVPQDQVMGPRMMMAMFTRPVEGNPDQLQTEIEFREGGSIFANGQQIQ